MPNGTPIAIRIVTGRDPDGYTLLLRYSDGAEHPIAEWFSSVAEAQDRAQHLAERFSDDLDSTIVVEAWAADDTKRTL